MVFSEVGRASALLIWAAIGMLFCTLFAGGAALAQDETDLRLQIQQFERSGQLEKAVSAYTTLFKLKPNDTNVARGLARALNAAGQHERVVAHLRRWLNEHEDDVMSHLLLGDAQQQMGQSAAAVKSWRRLLKVRAGDPAIYQQVSDRCQAAGQSVAAIDVLLDGRKALGSDEYFTWELAALYLDEGQYGRAVPLFLKSLEQSPNRLPVIEHRLGPLCQSDGALLQALLAIDDGDADPLPLARLTSTCALFAGVPEKGLPALEALAARPEIADLIFQYASQCEARGFVEVAARAYGIFAAQRSDSPYLFRALLKRAQIAARGPDPRAALEHYGELVRRFPGRPEALQALVGMAKLQLESGIDPELMVAGLRPVLESPQLGPWTAAALALAAEGLLRAGQLPEALVHIERLEKQGEQAAYEAGYRRAELRYFAGDCQAVIESLNQLTTSNAAHPLANDALDLLLVCEEYQNEELLASLVKAQLLERQRHPQQAETYWQAVFAQASPRLLEWALLQRASWAQSARPELALALYGRLLREFPAGQYQVEARINSALLHERAGDRRAALRLCEAALLAAPDDARAPELRLRIQRLRQMIASGNS